MEKNENNNENFDKISTEKKKIPMQSKKLSIINETNEF